MVELTIDGKTVEVPEGSMVMHAAHKLGVYVPHFCYHKKLSIAANCRMCLVEVEKAPKPMPACATPATNGMVVYTQSELAVAAQKSVMEFLLINHPLDCPICDQGGECQLQDLAVGYGASSTRYMEEKRVVFHKSFGPLVSGEEMTRCIHCTRCVRFGQEIGGLMEMGMIGRGEHSEITTYLGHTIESELSGNMIDICPVGALTSKPFRYSARTWELARRRSVSAHDSLGANIIVQVKLDEIKRVVPFENEDVNECWISDRDRFAYEGLAVDRLEQPMVRGDDGEWREATWADALKVATEGLAAINTKEGAAKIGAIGTETATLEEMSLLARLIRGLGGENVDMRTRMLDPEFDANRNGAPWLGMPIADLGHQDRVLVVGSFMRADHPLMTQRLRQAVKRGTQVNSIDLAADDPFMPLHARMTVRPSEMANALAQVAVAVAKLKSVEVPAEFAGVVADETAQRIAESLVSGQTRAILLGNAVVHAQNASQMAANAQWIAQQVDGRVGYLTAAANTVGAYLSQAVPGENGLSANEMLREPLSAYITLNLEPALDSSLGIRAAATLKNAPFVVALTTYRSAAQDWANVMLPIGPYTETSGTFVNAAGQPQSFKGVVTGFAQSRPAWKVLRVMGNLLELPHFEDESSESVRDSVLSEDIQSRLNNETKASIGVQPKADAAKGLERVADLPIYRSDAMVRRADALQQTPASDFKPARIHPETLASLSIEEGEKVRLSSDSGEVTIAVQADTTVPQGAVRLSAGFAQTAVLGCVDSQLQMERI
ncbi:NADH-quinone oxidoreductase subunit NuoG [Orrella sp. 11846]|uniref:NADH-quinone oxidoreductase subunit NuoG n=1 Tax=Orrella sp. 11846 TaxID=3409913 RepID=UPI003B599BAA